MLTYLCGDVMSSWNVGPEKERIRLFQPWGGDDAHLLNLIQATGVNSKNPNSPICASSCESVAEL